MSDDPITALVRSVPVGPAFDGFAVFVVGGAVRDALRGLDPEDIDLMVVPLPGVIENPVRVLENRMKKRVNPESSFPVFIDHRNREVALPRTEESTGVGPSDFEANVVPAGTPVGEAVRVDLQRRDLTVNAMAANARESELFDPFGGERDLRNGVIRHVSEAFREDPLRVVRLARFAARLDADVAPETMALAREVAPRLAPVPVERITHEARKAFKQAPRPARFFRVLKRAGALPHTFPALAGLSVEARHRVHAHVRAMNDVAGRGHRLGFVAVAMGLGPARRRVFIDAQDLFNDEQRAIHEALRLAPEIQGFGDTDAERVVATAEDLRQGGGLAPHEAFMAAQARARAHGDAMPAHAVAERLRVAIRAVHRIDGETVMDRENVRPGRDVSGERFGEMLRNHRAAFLRERA